MYAIINILLDVFVYSIDQNTDTKPASVSDLLPYK